MINAGATIIDVGGESTRPGAADVSVEEELARVVPVVEAIAQRFEVWISVDTSKPEVIREVARVGAHIINDIRSLTEPVQSKPLLRQGCCVPDAHAGAAENHAGGAEV